MACRADSAATRLGVVAISLAAGACALGGLSSGGVGSGPSTEDGAADGGGGGGDGGGDAVAVTDGPSTGDVTPGNDGAADAGTDGAACNLSADFGAPTALAEINSTDEDILSDLSADELTVYVASNHGVSGVQLFYATRAKRTDAFGALSLLLAAPGAYDDWGIAVSPDGLTGVISSDRTGQDDMFVVTRPNTLSTFGNPGAASAINSASDEQSPRWSPDGKTFYFDSSRGGGNNRDLFRADATGAGFGAPTAITELNTAAIEAGPVLSPDELTIYFLSTRAPTTDGDIYVATRVSKAAPFGTPKQVPNVNGPALDGPARLSSDGCALYMSSTRNGGRFDAFVARRPK